MGSIPAEGSLGKRTFQISRERARRAKSWRHWAKRWLARARRRAEKRDPENAPGPTRELTRDYY